MVKCSNGNPDCRSFKILGSGIDFKGGRYIAESKAIAAKRAGSKLFEKIHNNPDYKKYSNKTSIKFIMGETTKGSKKCTTAYQVNKIVLDKPKEIKKGGLTISVRYTYSVVKLANQQAELDSMNVINNPLFSP